jgi:SRSO17 transposase
VVLADAAYGNDNGFREGLETLGFEYVVGIQSSTSVWPPGVAPLPPQARSKMGRPARLLRRDEQHQPLSASKLAQRHARHHALAFCPAARTRGASRLLAQ